ncbi:hypothetical protein, partial [Litorivivens sp.]|uniref:hypothetical protein n=1 Tax=Litorivivens sp. TaxID=2020868 RepID=UPI00356875C0
IVMLSVKLAAHIGLAGDVLTKEGGEHARGRPTKSSVFYNFSQSKNNIPSCHYFIFYPYIVIM